MKSRRTGSIQPVPPAIHRIPPQAIAAIHRKAVGIIHHPGRQFWVVTEPPAPPANRWPEVLGKYTL